MNLLLLLELLLLAGFGIFVAIYARKNAAAVEDGAPMPKAKRFILTAYLLVFGTGLVWMLVSLGSLDFPETPVVPREIALPTATPTPPTTPGPTPVVIQAAPSTATPANTAPILLRIFPESTLGSAPPTVSLAVYGKNFSRDSKVRFNMERLASDFISDNLIVVQLQPANLVGKGSITVDVVNADGAVSNALTVPIEKPRVQLNLFFVLHPEITREIQLLLLVIFAGALGSYLHAIMSLADFIGMRSLTASWFWWYITRPFLGMAMALVFYAVLRGGFLAGTPADAKVVNPFGVIAIGALVGMFSDKAAQKLGEVFDVVFRSENERSDKLGAPIPVIDKLDPATVLAGSIEPVTIKIVGDRLGKVLTVRVNGKDRKPDQPVAQKEISFKLNPDDVASPGEIKIVAVNADGGLSQDATLTVSGPMITRDPETKPLSNAKAGSPYSEQIEATGGAFPYEWSLAEKPAWLTIDQTGKLTGTPAPTDVNDVNKVTVKVKDKDGASSSKTYNVKVIV